MNKYPREMTIVLQYQYQDLAVDSKGFTVSLSFNGVKEKIYIPFTAITTFADPSVQFGLQFREVGYTYPESEEMDLEVELDDEKPKKKGEKKPKSGDNNVVSLEQFRKDKK